MPTFTACVIMTILIVYFSFSSIVSGCYITNCPWGGKRSLNDNGNDLETVHSCRRCANGEGTCFGPSICCSPGIGCLMDTKESYVCRGEDTKSNIPCSPYGKRCYKIEFGKCATSNLCCNPDQCVTDPECNDDELVNGGSDYDYQNDLENSQLDVDNKEVDRKLIKALGYLLEKKQRRLQKQQSESDEIENSQDVKTLPKMPSQIHFQYDK